MTILYIILAYMIIVSINYIFVRTIMCKTYPEIDWSIRDRNICLSVSILAPIASIIGVTINYIIELPSNNNKSNW